MPRLECLCLRQVHVQARPENSRVAELFRAALRLPAREQELREPHQATGNLEMHSEHLQARQKRGPSAIHSAHSEAPDPAGPLEHEQFVSHPQVSHKNNPEDRCHVLQGQSRQVALPERL